MKQGLTVCTLICCT
uniref:Uncharacterized protein n=1 Tax=Anguilla anguilla TaxID=7936 RepID=A0A0E9S033_ANGAN